MKLIFIHGSGNSGEVWHYQTQHFSDAEAVNLPGHPQGEPCSSVESYTDWLHRYICSARASSPPVLIGHSLGSAIAQMYALEYPEDIKALVLVGAGARLRVGPQFLSLIRDGIENPSIWLKNLVEPRYCQVAPEVREKVMREIAQIGAAVMLNDFLCCDKFDIMDKVHQIKAPVLILCGSEDQMTPPKYSSYLANKIVGAKLVIINGGTHFAFAEKPEMVNQEIDKFLDDL
jgi:pimeloyl-ACP methyl ester carboxylesterase